jgi:hypothetical protein
LIIVIMFDKRVVVSVLLSLLSVSVASAENVFSAKYRIEHRQGASTDKLSHQVLNDTLLQSALRYQQGLDWTVDAVLRARYESELEPDPYKEIDLREFYFSKNTAHYSLKLGRQQVVWGKTDGLRLLDVVNPLDLREFILDDFVDSRIPLWMLNNEWYLGDNSIQFLLVPQLTFDRLAKEGGQFYFEPDVPEGLQSQILETKTPAQSPKNWQYALKWARQVGDWDLTLNGIYGWGNDPVFFYQFKAPATIEFQPEIRRRRSFGASGDKPLGESVFRFEAIYTPDEYRQVDDNLGERGFIRQHLLSFALGLDWYKSNWLISPQWFQEVIINPDSNLSKRTDTSYASLLIHKKYIHDKLNLELFYLYGVTDHDRWFAPYISYQMAGKYELSLKFDMFSGANDTLFGRFSNNDRIVLGLAAYL